MLYTFERGWLGLIPPKKQRELKHAPGPVNVLRLYSMYLELINFEATVNFCFPSISVLISTITQLDHKFNVHKMNKIHTCRTMPAVTPARTNYSIY